MNIQVVIEPHERHEALEAYKDWLAPDQLEQIDDAPEGALIHLTRIEGATLVRIIPEG